MSILDLLRPRAALLSLIVASLASAQNTNLLGTAPSCAQSCAVLQQAQQTCQSQGGALSTIASCLCTQESTTNLRSTGEPCSDSCTSSSDQNNVVGWFANFCAAPQTVTALPAAAATTAPMASSAAATATGASSTGSSSDGNAANAYETNDQSWWDEHSKWIAMVIVLIVAFSIIIGVGIWWKKRHTRKQNARNALPPSAVWGPQQSHPSVDRLGTSQSSVNILNFDAEKGRGRPTSTVTRQQSEMSGALRGGQSSPGTQRTTDEQSQGGGKRLKKLGKVLRR